MKKTLLVVLGVVILVGLFVGSIYNSLVKQREAIDGQWAQVESQYQRRFDLIPNLVATVKGIFKQEQAVFGEIAEARTRYAGASTPSDKVTAANQVESSLARLLVIIEQYPELKSAESVRTLMSQLEGTENRVSVERMRFNDLVKDYNARMKTFPTNIIAGTFGFETREYFQADAAALAAPNVEF
ncbi:MAG TPA: LemA family protein [Candidatus Paceibacterota bacterium]